MAERPTLGFSDVAGSATDERRDRERAGETRGASAMAEA
jgi:hypothetical protein